jgi:hypothetical protein
MREYQTTAVVDEDGKLQFQLKTDLAPGKHKLRVVVDEELTDEQRELLRQRQSLGVLVDDWDDPAMKIYDDL